MFQNNRFDYSYHHGMMVSLFFFLLFFVLKILFLEISIDWNAALYQTRLFATNHNLNGKYIAF